jgi:hypothetical protein
MPVGANLWGTLYPDRVIMPTRPKYEVDRVQS